MIPYSHFILDNGLKVYVIEDHSTPMAAVNILYNVGSRDEDENRTGFAHLFEHLMFGGSKNIPSYDVPLQKVGAENNAFTTPDITNYFITLPAVNIETAFWLESDRMMGLSFDPQVLEVQQKVVIEEFNQRYLNQPYGDVWLKLRPLAYQQHPYRWATIGKDISHIANATIDDVRSFFYQYYLPNNATMVVAGNVTVEQVKQLCKKWFEPITSGQNYERNIPKEPVQTKANFLDVSAKVPLNGLYKVWKMPGRFEDGFHATDLLSDIAGRGKSSRLYQKLFKQKPIFSNINAYITASLDTGLLVVQGHLNKGVSLEDADAEVNNVIEALMLESVAENELSKVKQQAESSLVFSEIDLLSRATNLAVAANVGRAEWVNEDPEKVKKVTVEDLFDAAKAVLQPTNCSTMYYRAMS